MQTEQTAGRPFHETVVDAIRNASNSSHIVCLAPLIIATSIPKNHDNIIAAWQERRKELGFESDDVGVPFNLLKKKKEAEEEKEGIKAQAPAALSPEQLIE